MKDMFVQLCGHVLGRNLEGSIESYQSAIVDKVNCYNDYFGKRSDKSRFVAVDEGVSLSPVPFSSTSCKPKIGFIGLNPKYDAGEASLEKNKGGVTWSEHGSFYTGEEVFRYVIEDKKSKYYQKQIKFLYALLNPKSDNIAISEIRKVTSLSEYELFRELTNACPIMFGEFIPFHSNSFSLSESKVKRMVYDLPGYKAYFDNLLDYIVKTIPSDGLIVVDGKTPTLVFEMLNSNEMELIRQVCREKDQKLLYDIYKWNERYVLLARSVICGSGTDLSSLNVVRQLTEDIRKYTEFTID